MAAPPPGSTCACPITKTVTVNFTGSTPAPSNGYIVGYRKAGTSAAYTYVSPNPTTSPVNITNVPVCEDIEVVMQSQCDNSQVSAPQTTTISAYTDYLCGDTINGSHTHNGFYAYPDYLLNVQGATDTVTLTYDVIDLPNRFTVYDANGNLVVTSGWRGTAAFAGPWGASLSTATTGTISFSKGGGCFFRLLVESSTNTSTQDAFNVGISCPITGDPPAPTITLLSCSSGYGSYRIDAPSGTNLKVKLTASGSLTNNSVSGYCARLDGTITSSTGPSDSEVSSIVTTTGAASIGSGNSLFVDVTIPGAGYLVINTTVFTVNSLAGSTTAALTIFEVNGTAANITQSVCVQNSTGVVSCGTPTYQNYYATKYSCTACETASLENGVLVAFATGISVVQGKFYVPDSGTGEVGSFVYLIGPSTNDGPGLIMQDLSATTCSGACQISNLGNE
jgi:hypothetical protein